MKKVMFVILLIIAYSAIYPQVNLTIMIKKPTPPKISEWQTDPTIAKLLIINSTGVNYQNAYVDINITNENGDVVAKSNLNSPSIPRFNINVGTTNLSGAQFFNVNAMHFESSISQSVTTTGSLPEGNYQFCVKLLDQNKNEISSTGALCDNFFIILSDPPSLILPAQNSEISVDFPQFIWTPATNVDPSKIIGYKIKVVPVYNHQTPKTALETNIPLIDKKIPTASYQYMPSDPALTIKPNIIGYAWQIQAVDQLNKPAAKSDGFSEINFFKIQTKPGFIPPGPIIPIIPPPMITINHKVLSGTLYYTEYDSKGSKIGSYPLKNVNLKLEIKYKLTDKHGNSCSEDDFLTSYHSRTDVNKSIATGSTNDKGEFSFLFLDPDSMGLIDSDYKSSGGEFYCQGKVHRVARIIIQSPYFTSPEDDFIIQPGESKTNLKIFTDSKNYRLKVKVIPTTTPGQTTYSPLKGVNVKITRHSRPTGVPETEGQASFPREMYDNKTVIAEGVTDINGEVEFRYLYQNYGGTEDKYYITAITDSTFGKYNYHKRISIFRFNDGNPQPVFEDKYNFPVVQKELEMIPKKPRVAGYVYRDDNKTKPIINAEAKLFIRTQLIGGIEVDLIEQTRLTDSSGYFSFNNLYILKDANENVTGPKRGVKFNKYGFRDTSIKINNYTPLSLGEQFIIPDAIYMKPVGIVKGKIVDEFTNIGVSSDVTIGDGKTVKTFSKVTGSKNVGGRPMPILENGYFESPAILGYQPFVVEPYGNYFSDTVYKNINKPDYNAGEIKVRKKLHRIKVHVYSKVGGYPYFLQKIVKAKVGIEGITSFIETDDDGYATLEPFESSSDSFKIKIYGPDGSDYIASELIVYNQISKYYKTYIVHIKKGGRISGKVFVGSDSTPVANAKVYLVEESTLGKLETFTDADGKYTLKCIPIGYHTFAAVKGGEGYIGDTISLNISTTEQQNINFKLSVYNGIDLTKLLGFNMSVYSLDSNSAGEYIIGGEIGDFIKDSVFMFDNGASLNFSNIKVKKSKTKNSSGTPYVEPVNYPLEFSSPYLNVKVNDAFTGRIKDLILESKYGGNNIGVLKGNVSIDAGVSFQTASISNLNNFYISLFEKPDEFTIPIINSKSGELSKSQKFIISSSSGNSSEFRLYDLKVKTDSSRSFILDQEARFYSKIYANIENASSIRVDIGEIIVNPKTTNVVQDIISSSIIDVDLSTKWKLQASKWSLTKNNGFILIEGILNTGSTVIPFTGQRIYPTGVGDDVKLQGGNFDFANLLLSGIVPVKISGSSQFGYDASQGCWIVGVGPSPGKTYCATISGLPGLNNSDTVYINSFRTKSQGNDGFNIAGNSPELIVYKVGKFQPSAIYAYPDFFQINGSFNINIPGVGIKSSALNYGKKSGGGINFTFDSFPFKIISKGVIVDFPGNPASTPQKFDESGFSAVGFINDEQAGMFEFKVKLYHNLDSTSIWIEPNQDFVISSNGARRLKNVYGSMKKMGSVWTNFYFIGDLYGAAGASGKLGFDVLGDFIPKDQKIKVENISTPFGDLCMTYDFANKRLIGSISLEREIANGSRMYGVANAVIDADGWFMVSAGGYEMHNPYAQVDAAMFIGDYPNPSAIAEFQQIFMADPKRYSYSGTIPQFLTQDVSGFYFTGMAKLPPPLIPSFNVDLDPFVSCYLETYFGGDMGFGADFNTNTVFLKTGTVIGVNAGAGASVGLACCGASFHTELYFGAEGEYNLSSGEWFIEGNANLTIGGGAYVGVGCCDSHCDCAITAFGSCVCPIPCYKESWSGSVTLGLLKLRLGKGGPKFCVLSLCN